MLKTPRYRSCPKCGRAFQGPPDKNYCGKGCKNQAAWESGGRARRGFRGICAQCGQEYQKPSYRATRTCSIRCGMAYRGSRKAPKRPKWASFTPLATWKPGAVTDAGYIPLY